MAGLSRTSGTVASGLVAPTGGRRRSMEPGDRPPDSGVPAMDRSRQGYTSGRWGPDGDYRKRLEVARRGMEGKGTVGGVAFGDSRSGVGRTGPRGGAGKLGKG